MVCSGWADRKITGLKKVVDLRRTSGMLGTNLSEALSRRQFLGTATCCIPTPYSVNPKNLDPGVKLCSVLPATTKSSSENAFCNHCGAPMTAAAGAAPAGATAAAPAAYAVQPDLLLRAPGCRRTAAAALAYVTIIPAIIFLVIEPFNKMPLVRFHSWQSIGLCIVATILQVLVAICEGMLHFIPGVFFLFDWFTWLVWLGFLAVWLFVILKAAKGEWYKLPIIGDFAEKQAKS